MEELYGCMELVQKLVPTTNRMSIVIFGPLIAMLIEEWCKANKMDITEFVRDMSEVIDEVQKNLGKY